MVPDAWRWGLDGFASFISPVFVPRLEGSHGTQVGQVTVELRIPAAKFRRTPWIHLYPCHIDFTRI
jgi:hypothetical protein